MSNVREDNLERSHAKRLIAAVVVVAVIVFSPIAIDSAFNTAEAEESDAMSANAEGLDAQALIGGKDASTVLEELEDAAKADGFKAVPPVFFDEIGFLPDARDVRVSADGAIVGYVVDDGVEEALANLLLHMEARGWAGVSLGGVDGYTFLKDSGQCTWVLATCTQVGDVTSVVMRVSG